MVIIEWLFESVYKNKGRYNYFTSKVSNEIYRSLKIDLLSIS